MVCDSLKQAHLYFGEKIIVARPKFEQPESDNYGNQGLLDM